MYEQSKKYDKLTLKLAILLLAPHTWAASLMPSIFAVLYGFLFVSGFTWYKGIFLIIACVLFQGTVNTLNDYIDYKKGTDAKEDNLEASDAVLLYNNLNPKSVVIFAACTFAIAVILCCISAIGAGYVPFTIGIIGAVVIYTYSGGKLPISYLPIGELVSGFVMGGLIPLGILSCFDGRWHFSILILSMPFIIGIALIMMSNNGCDIEKDIVAKRKTFPVLLGRKKTLMLYKTLLIVWMICSTIVSYMITGLIGIIVCVAGLLLGYRVIVNQYKLHLTKEDRIFQMKGIMNCNYLINGVILVSLLIKIIMECVNV